MMSNASPYMSTYSLSAGDAGPSVTVETHAGPATIAEAPAVHLSITGKRSISATVHLSAAAARRVARALREAADELEDEAL